MTEREQEKELLDALCRLSESEVFRVFARLIKLRFEMHKTALVTNESAELRGKAQECRHLIKELKMNGD